MEEAPAWPLRCPQCSEPARLERRPNGRPAALLCHEGHRYDAAKQGHINLLTGRPSKFLEDTPAMIASREAWLETGAYAPLALALGELALRHTAATDPLVVDTGAGTGWYTRRVLDALTDAGRTPHAVDLDLSRAGAQRAARDPRVLSLVWDTWRPWPLTTGSASLLLDVFAPRNAAEFARVLRPGGVALVAVPLPGHLAQLRDDAGLLGIDEAKEERLAATLAADFDELETLDVDEWMHLTPQAAALVAHMGPAGHHRGLEQILEQLGRAGDRDVRLSVRVHAYRRR
ncbi:MAG: SAM-dependent methyltransferase [Arthrobacter sp.]|nr:SAM-dependent methyltransferase [Arthrobacter sp.]